MSTAPTHDQAGQPPADSYVVVARRYRPQTFDELIGQQHVASALVGAIQSGRVGHAYLFTGARGVGKTSAARIFAKAINCPEAHDGIPCNKCEICESISAGGDVDVLEIDGASNRGIDEIRQLRQNVAVRPSRSKHKVYIIDEVHMLTKEAFNALLKTLEEPPEHVKFIFATTEPNKIPITILSRCQRFDFAGIDTVAIQNRLGQIAEAEGATIDQDALGLLAMRAAGSMRDSQSLLEQLLGICDGKITAADVTSLLGIAPAARLTAIVRPLVERDAAGALRALDEALSDGSEVGQVVDQLLGTARDALTQAVGCEPGQMLHTLPAQRDEVAQIGRAWGVETLLAVIQVLDHAASRMRITTQSRTLAEMALVRICRLENLDAIRSLIEGLQSGEPQGLPATPPRLATAPPPPAASVPQTPPRPEPPRAEAQPPQDTTPPPQGTAELPDDLAGLWQRAVHHLEGMLQSFAAEADEFADDGGTLVAMFPEDQPMALEKCHEPTSLSRIEAVLRDAAGGRVPFRLATHEVRASAEPTMKKSRRRTEAEVATEPIVQKAVELFQGDSSRLRYIPPDDAS